MQHLMKPLLTIGIPTFNRSSFLDRALYFLSNQHGINNGDIEIIISDNSSIDGTTDVVNKYINLPLDIQYYRNETNIGADKNIVQCFKRARGKFVWIMGDDDYLVPGALPQIVQLLKEYPAIGVCYMRSKWLLDPGAHKPEVISTLQWSVESNAIAYLTKVHYWITFLSGNIINKEILSGIEIDKYIDSNLIQLGWTIPAIFKTGKNIVIENELLICQGNNTGGYNLIKVFAHSFNEIMNDFIKQGYNKKLKTIINTNLLSIATREFEIFISKLKKSQKRIYPGKRCGTCLPDRNAQAFFETLAVFRITISDARATS
jgi:glycosyltransferase involved in cell wall biosynthesis